MDQVTNNVRRNNWIAMIQDQKQSGLTVSAWCKQANISTNCFYYRQQKLREAAASAIPQLVEINASELATQITEDEAPNLDNKTAFISSGSVSIALTNAASAQLIQTILRALNA